jgi:hypothetical protein
MNTRLALLALAVSACRSSSATGIAQARADEVSPSRGGVAVVELFTSEGCSSCPPADVLLADLERRSLSVFALEFHVDYWDNLGWADRFSSDAWTRRQQAYARAFGSTSLYTPQMIVGGTDPFNGSDRTRAQADLARSLATIARVHLSVHVRRAGTETVAVDVDAPAAPTGASFDVAVVQREAATDVLAGENAGRTLRHVNVVRAFTVARLPAATVNVEVPASMRRSEGEVIAFVQEEGGGARGSPILGATRAPLPE